MMNRRLSIREQMERINSISTFKQKEEVKSPAEQMKSTQEMIANMRRLRAEMQ